MGCRSAAHQSVRLGKGVVMYSIEAPNYPETKTDEFFKYTKKKVEGFAGLQERNGPYGAVSSISPSDGSIDFCCDKDMSTDQFLEIVDWVESNSGKLLALALESFVELYWEMRDLVIESLIDEDPDDVVPEIKSYDDLRKLCGIVAVHVKGKSDNGDPLFGIEFGCTWEDEHGAGAGFEGFTIKESGHASDAFDFV